MWISVSARLPKPFELVWVKTSTGRQTTAHVNAAGEWRIKCPRIAADNPEVISWKE